MRRRTEHHAERRIHRRIRGHFRGRKPSLPAETKVINLHDAEPGTVLNGFTYDHDLGEWTAYEIVTAYGIERWQRRDFAVLDDLEQAKRDADAE